MTTYTTMLGAVFLSSSFVFYIWLKVFVSALKTRNTDLPRYQVLITSTGLVVYSCSILFIISFRIFNLYFPFSLDNYIYLSYVGMVCSDVLFLISAAIGDSFKQIKWLLAILAVWLLFCLVTNIV